MQHRHFCPRRSPLAGSHANIKYKCHLSPSHSLTWFVRTLTSASSSVLSPKMLRWRDSTENSVTTYSANIIIELQRVPLLVLLIWEFMEATEG